MKNHNYAERIAAWRQENPDKRLTFDLLLEICDETDLSYADLRNVNLTDADLRNVDLRRVSLKDANLTYANLSGANLTDADLRGADLGYANLRGANLRGANLKGMNLWRADWDGLQITGLPSGQIVLIPTSDGWELHVGCWHGTIDDLRTLIAQDEGWPEAEGEEIALRRPGLQAALALIDAHVALVGP